MTILRVIYFTVPLAPLDRDENSLDHLFVERRLDDDVRERQGVNYLPALLRPLSTGLIALCVGFLTVAIANMPTTCCGPEE